MTADQPRRWRFFYDNCGILPAGMSPRDDGEYVRFEDYESVVASLTKERDEWKVAADLLGNRLIKAELRVESLTKERDGLRAENIQAWDKVIAAESRVESLEKALKGIVNMAHRAWEDKPTVHEMFERIGEIARKAIEDK